ncbi:MAG: ribonuclease H-like domain-containing protein [Candidatus Methanomethylicia archaeon]|nr:ribonuclease H-like domain-containing protein [Candidatus Methanomethylicia archaeon]
MQKIAFLDIETTSLTADSGFIVGIGIMWEDGSWIHEFLSGNVIEGEKELINKVINLLSNVNVIITWNGENFDIPMLISRALVHEINPAEIVKKEHIDLYKYAKRLLKLSDYSLDSVAKYVNIPKKVELKGKDMPPYYMKAISGDQNALKMIIEHCYDDLQALKLIYEKMKEIVKVVREKEIVVGHRYE